VAPSGQQERNFPFAVFHFPLTHSMHWLFRVGKWQMEYGKWKMANFRARSKNLHRQYFVDPIA
jgi:hypothetical protein